MGELSSALFFRIGFFGGKFCFWSSHAQHTATQVRTLRMTNKIHGNRDIFWTISPICEENDGREIVSFVFFLISFVFVVFIRWWVCLCRNATRPIDWLTSDGYLELPDQACIISLNCAQLESNGNGLEGKLNDFSLLQSFWRFPLRTSVDLESLSVGWFGGDVQTGVRFVWFLFQQRVPDDFPGKKWLTENPRNRILRAINFLPKIIGSTTIRMRSQLFWWGGVSFEWYVPIFVLFAYSGN